MAKDFARKFKKLVSAQVEGQSDNLIGTVLSVHPIEISCHGGQWLLTADDLQISNHVILHTGDSVVLSGEDPFSVLSVLSDADPDEYEPPESLASISNAEIDELTQGWASGSGGGSSAAGMNHALTTNRDAADAHPISAISQLDESLSGKVSASDALTNMELFDLIGE